MLCLLEQCSEVVQELTELISTAPCTMKEKCTLLLPEEFPAFLAGEGSKELLQSAVEELRVNLCAAALYGGMCDRLLPCSAAVTST